MDANADTYAAARTNLRDNVKTMATILAGTAGAVIAGSPFSGLGSLEPLSGRFAIALVGLLVAAICLFLGWKRLTFTLRPDAFYTEVLRSTFTEEEIGNLGLTSKERDELIAVKREFDRRSRSLLPEKITTYEALEKWLNDEWEKADRDKDYDDYERNLRDIGYWAAFTRLSARVERGLRFVQRVGSIGIVGLIVFAWAANPKKDDPPPKPVVVHVSTCASCPVPPLPPPQPEPLPAGVNVLFETNRHTLDTAAFAVISDASATLRRNPSLGALLLAHTDMVAGEQVNRILATRRAQTVQQALLKQGGVATSRVFIAELPRTDLPVVTAPGTAQTQNRSVEILFVRLPLPAR